MSKQSATDNIKKLLPKLYHKRKYYNLSQLQFHNSPNDIWVSFFHDIYDLTSFVQNNRHLKEIDPIIAAAGTDITHWFDQKTKQPRTFVNPNGQIQYYIPQGKYLHLDSAKDPLTICWWKNQQFFIGKLTKKSQSIKIINTLSNTEDKLQVPCQQTIWQILNRYQQINIHAKSYTWKRKGKILKMQCTLAQNGIVDQTQVYEQLEVPIQQRYVPAIHIHFNDDLTKQYLIEEMKQSSGVLSSAHLTCYYRGAPSSSYNRLMQSSTKIYPERQQYVTERMVNNVQRIRVDRLREQAKKDMEKFINLRNEMAADKIKNEKRAGFQADMNRLYL